MRVRIGKDGGIREDEGREGRHYIFLSEKKEEAEKPGSGGYKTAERGNGERKWRWRECE